MDNGNTVRVTATLPQDMMMTLKYWSQKRGVSINQYVADAIALSVKLNNDGYKTPTQECERVNQCRDLVLEANSAVNSMTKNLISGFDTLLSVTRGYNILLRNEDGDIEVNTPFEE